MDLKNLLTDEVIEVSFTDFMGMKTVIVDLSLTEEFFKVLNEEIISFNEFAKIQRQNKSHQPWTVPWRVNCRRLNVPLQPIFFSIKKDKIEEFPLKLNSIYDPEQVITREHKITQKSMAFLNFVFAPFYTEVRVSDTSHFDNEIRIQIDTCKPNEFSTLSSFLVGSNIHLEKRMHDRKDQLNYESKKSS